MHVGPLPNMEAVPVQIDQLFANLIGNALKISKEDHTPIIKISARDFPAKEVARHASLSSKLKYCEIIVSDNGIGFDPKYREQIFMVFQRLRRSRGQKGTGIGLSLVKKIVDNYQGMVFTKSEEGKGAAFHVVLPFNQLDCPL